ncbi:EAL domain-containing response regulator [Vineibacter terrae]|uniref:EAL domain-containing response regulator n=1 Tax=Vineibacter terrae TaxID=2586908 RepID=A0A5C8PEN9_9HYPH|nr:EAL domain-containing response regulator [Vineibacter terrae]TXL71960.1 EAL domain-containing response regulator [Vineibacter terrae]
MASASMSATAPVKPQIVIVEDDDDFRELLVELAVRLNFTVRAAASGEELFWLLRMHAPDALVLDLRLPDTDAIEIVGKLGDYSLKPYVVLMSGEDEAILDATEELARSSGLEVVGTLAKPFSGREMQRLLNAIKTQIPDRGSYQDQSLITQLKLGIPNDELVLHYQPKLNFSDHSIEGVEALVRWNHPTHGLLGPLAEYSEVIIPLTWSVLKNAIRQHVAWKRDGIVLPVSINVSASFLDAAETADVILKLLRTQRCAPSDLTLELTEAEVAGNPTAALDILARLRLHGIRVAMDDYGIGFSDLAQLHRYPFTDIKIDRSLVNSLETDPRARQTVDKVIDVARGLGVKITAEGVETADQWRLLHEIGCDMAQGFLISRPLPDRQLRAWLANGIRCLALPR